MPSPYDSLPPPFQGYVDALLEHAQGALWPERRAALESFHRGIARGAPEELAAAAAALGLAAGSGEAAAQAVFRRILTAYLDRLDETTVTNPDQAFLYALSLDPDHVELARRWATARAGPAEED